MKEVIDPYTAKDLILGYLHAHSLAKGGGVDDREIAQAIKLPRQYVVVTIEELIKEEMVDALEIASRHNEGYREYMTTISAKGAVKYFYQGGYKADLEIINRDILNKKTSTVLNVINAVLILVLTGLNIWVSNKTTYLEKKIDKLTDENDSLKRVFVISTPKFVEPSSVHSGKTPPEDSVFKKKADAVSQPKEVKY